MTAIDTQKALDALHFIPADTDRDTWVRAGMAARAAGLSFDDFDAWSAQAGNYDAAAARDTWRSFKDGKGIGAGTLFRMAAEHGWSKSKKPPALVVAPVRQARQEPAPRPPAPGMGAIEVWSRCKPATHAHPYIGTKKAAGVPLEHLRVVPADDPMVVNGQRMAGALVVPAYGIHGELQSLQLIPPPGAGKKLNLPGHPMAGACHVVGNLEPGSVVYICEGIGAAWSCWQATGRAAVVAFGSGNMGRIAAELRAQVDNAKLVLVPDTGKEQDAERIAKEVGATFVTMPEGWEKNSDVNDLAQRDGLDALADWLEMEPVKPAAEQTTHPLAQFVKLRKVPQAVKWVVPGVIEHGVVTIAGSRGVGKTTSLLPLALSAAGLHEPGYPLAPHPERWRHVVYAVEQVEQAERILAGLVECSGMGITWEQVEERLHLVETVRLDVDTVVQVAGTYREQFTRVVDGVEVLPLVVFDTQAASFEMDNENDNTEASRIMAALKQRFEKLPVWILGHVAKASIGRSDVSALTMRGGGAFEADSIANLYLVEDPDKQRYLSIGKHRAEPRFGKELLIESGDQIVTGFNEWNEPEDVHLRWAIVRPMEQSRAELREQSEEIAAKLYETEMRGELFAKAKAAWESGDPLSRRGLEGVVGGKNDAKRRLIESLLNEGRLVEREIPAKLRRVSSKKVYLLPMEPDEFLEFKTSGALPTSKSEHPVSWLKAPKAPENAPADEVEKD